MQNRILNKIILNKTNKDQLLIECMNAILHITFNAKDRRGNELFLFCKESNFQKVSKNKGKLITSSAPLSI